MSLALNVDACLYDEASAASDKFDRITGVQELGDFSFSADTLDDTPYGSDQDGWRGYDYGLKDAGETTIRIRNSSGNTAITTFQDALMNSTKLKIAIKFPAAIGKQLELDVLVTSDSNPMGKEAKLDRTFGLKISGAPVWNTLVPIA